MFVQLRTDFLDKTIYKMSCINLPLLSKKEIDCLSNLTIVVTFAYLHNIKTVMVGADVLSIQLFRELYGEVDRENY